MLKIYNFVIFQ